MSFDILSKCAGFEWDEHNTVKILLKHDVSPSECEQIFFNLPFVVVDDIEHSETEDRFYALGQTDPGRLLFLVFTVRRHKVRVISARDMNRKERSVYRSYEK